MTHNNYAMNYSLGLHSAWKVADKVQLFAELYGKTCVEVRQSIEATTLTAEAAANLNESEGTPCLRIRRRYVSARGKTLLITVSYHPGDRYAFNLNVRLDRQKQCVESDLMD